MTQHGVSSSGNHHFIYLIILGEDEHLFFAFLEKLIMGGICQKLIFLWLNSNESIGS